VIASDILKSTFLPGDDDTGGPEVGGIRSGRGGVLGVHFAVNDPSFGGVWRDAFLSVSAIMLFMSCLEKSLSWFRYKRVGWVVLDGRSYRFPSGGLF